MRAHPSAQTNPAVLFLLLAILLGGYVRLSQVVGADFPLNDGGLFYAMTRDLQENQYRLPVTTSYNQLDIPFAYPPLPFYLAGGLNDLLGWELIDIFRVLPAIFSVLGIPAFFLLAQSLVKNPAHVGVATLIFALLPTTFDWLIMGGGLTRAPAFFFALLTLHRIYLLYTRDAKIDILWTALLASVTILSHPETALHTALSALVFFFFFGRRKAGVRKSVAVAGLVLLLTAGWWLPNLAHHGLDPYLAAGRTGWHSLQAVVQLLRFDITNEYGLATIGGLALVGFFWQLARRQTLLPVWLLVIFISEPRSAPLYLTPLIALLAGDCLLNILAGFPVSGQSSSSPTASGLPLASPAAKGLFALLFAQWTLSALVITLILAGTKTLTGADQSAFAWIDANTSADSRFLVLTGDDPLSDPTSEWFPALTGRSSVATVQGYEWDGSHEFETIKERGRKIQNCLQQTPACIQEWKDEYRLEFDYIYLRKLALASSWSLAAQPSSLEALLLNDGHVVPVYQSAEVTILQLPASE